MPYITLNDGHRLFYRHYGGSGPVVLLIHGLASSSSIWLRQIRVLQKHFRVYAIDLPGHGKSDHWRHYSFDLLTHAIGEWMEQCELSRVNIVALSLGCSVGLSFALKFPDRLESLVLQSPISGFRRWWNPFAWQDWILFQVFPILLYLSMIIFGRKRTARWVNKLGNRGLRNLNALINAQTLADFRAIRELLWESAFPHYIKRLEDVRNPVLIVKGRFDNLPRQLIHYLETHLFYEATVEVPGVCHLVSLENPMAFNDILLEFLKKYNLYFHQIQEEQSSAV